MKNQRMKFEHKIRPMKLIAVMAMLAIVSCLCAVLVSATNENAPVVEIDASTGVVWDNVADAWVKTYDGDREIDCTNGTVKVVVGAVKYNAVSATFSGKNAGEQTLTVVWDETPDITTDANKVMVLPARIDPVELTWSGIGTGEVRYNPIESLYSGVAVTLPTDLALEGNIVAGDVLTIGAAEAVSFESVEITQAAGGPVKTFTKVAVSGEAIQNYKIPVLPVEVTVTPIKITNVVWEGADTLVYGEVDANGVPKALLMSAVAQYVPAGETEPVEVQLKVMVRTGEEGNYKYYTLAEAYELGIYGNVYKGKTEQVYTLEAQTPDRNLYDLEGTERLSKSVTIQKAVYEISMSDATYLGEADLSDPTNIKPMKYQLLVNGAGIPESVLKAIKYTYYDANGKEIPAKDTVNGISTPGIYTVKATLPSLVGENDVENYEFKVTGELSATLTVKKNFLAVGTNDQPYQMIIIGQNGLSDAIKAEFSIPESLDRDVIYGYHVHKEYTIRVIGGNGEAFKLIIPVFSDLLSDPNCDPLKVEDLYICDGVGNMAPASEKYTVTLEDGYYIIEGFDAEAAVTFVIAPVYTAPFWVTAPGIALIIFLVLLALLLLFVIGLKLRQIERSATNMVLTIDTEGDVPEFEPVVIEDKIDDPEACLAESIDDMAEALRADVAPTETEEETEVDASEAVAESLAEMTAEAEAIDLAALAAQDPDVIAATELADAMAAEKAEGLMDQVDAAEANYDVSDEVSTAVAAAMAENFNESADATDAIVLLADEDEEISPEAFREIIDSIVADAMTNTMILPDGIFSEETVEETAEEAVEETVEEAVEETVEEVVEETVEESVEETAEEAVEEVAEETEEADASVCAIVADSVAEAFEVVTVDGVVPEAVEGTTMDSITAAVNNAAQTYVPEDWSEEMTDEVKVAVVEELAARLLKDNGPDDGEELAEEPVEESAEEPVEETAEEAPVEEAPVEEAPVEETPAEEAPAEEAVVENAEAAPESDEDDEDENEGEEEEEDSSFAGFGSMPLEFIDVMVEAERYNEMLAQESAGEVQLVTRYRRSFRSRLAQSVGGVQDYYNVIKNLLLSYKGIKNRVSWNYESFNLGRAQVAKFNAKTRTLYLYMALDPEALAETKYTFKDMSSKKKYAGVPVLMKIKGDRKFKHALEMITMLCEEKLQLPKKKNFEEADYKLTYMTTEQLVEAGLIKKLVAAIPMSVINGEAPVEETPAVETPVEETPVEETPVEETPVEEIAADAKVTDEEPTNA